MKIRLKKQYAKGGEIMERTRVHSSLPMGDNQEITPSSHFNKTIKQVPRDKSNLEAEKGETVVTNMSDDSGIPELYDIQGKKHSKGGTPLNVPEGSFFFSDTPSMRIKDKEILKMFDMDDGKKHTPAEISKKYDINKYRQILADKYSSKMEKRTAELMIKKYAEKLGKLALIQESMKGFEDGLPDIASAYAANSKFDARNIFKKEESNPQELTNNFIENNDEVEPEDFAGEEVNQMRKGGQKNKMTKLRMRKFTPGGDTQTTQSTSTTTSGLGQFSNNYNKLLDKMKDEKLQKALVAKIKEKIQTLKPNKNLKQSDIDSIKKMSDEELINTFLYGEKRVFTFNNNGVIQKGWDKDPEAHNRAAKQLGLKTYTPAQVGAFQLGYQAIGDLANSDEFKETLKDFDVIPTGPEHTGYTGKKTNISPVDGYWGDNTANQGVRLKKEGESTSPEGKDKDKKTIKHLQPGSEDRPEWMTQDMINLAGAISDRDMLHKYGPWSAPIIGQEVNPTFTDFRNNAQRLNSAVAGSQRAQTAFSGPQARAALANEGFGNYMESLGSLSANENTTNVNISNNFAMQNAQRQDALNEANATRKIKDYDNWVSMQSDFDAEKLKYKQNIRNMLNNAITNRGKLQMMNSLNDNYKVDRNGILKFKPTNTPITPSTPQDEIQNYINLWKIAKENNPNDPEAFIAGLNDNMSDYYSRQREDARAKKDSATDYALNYADILSQQMNE